MHPLEQVYMILRAIMLVYGVSLIFKFFWVLGLYIRTEIL